MGENDSILEMYLYESSMLLDQLDDILLQSEKDKTLSAESIDEIFRIMHTIKGSSAMMEFDLLSHVAHKMEDLFFFVRENSIEGTYFKDLMNIVLEASDFLKEEIEKVRDNLELATENQALIEKMSSLLSEMKGDGHEAEGASAGTSPTETSPGEALPDDGQLYHLHVHFTADCQMENVRAFMLVNKLRSLGEVIRTIPEELENNQDSSSIIINNGFYCSLSSDASREEVEAAARGASSVERVEFVESLPSALTTAKASASAAAAETEDTAEKATDCQAPSPNTPGDASSSSDSSSSAKGGKQNLIAVDLNKLDTLMDLVGEIVITESMVSGSQDLEGLVLENFNKSSRQLRKLTDELQDIVMSIRMVPVAATFQKMRRIVRDMNNKLGRDVELVLMGESTEVDKTIIDGIVDPLMHLVRNAMDHGIEDRAVREAAGKDPKGQIILSAQNVAGDIIITVSDDGAGLDSARILEKAKGKNLLVKPENEYTEKEIFNLLTLPGFSTKDSVTEFSGRGVGMDVVKKNIEKIGGTITIESVKNVGTTVFFKIPLTLAIISTMHVRVGKEVYAVPVSNIRQSFEVSVGQIFTDPDGHEMVMLRETCYPLIRLNRTYHIENSRTEAGEGILMLVESSEGMGCLFMDGILGKHQVVVKPLPRHLSRFNLPVSGISGCTILGDGSICLILDVQAILKQY